MATLCRHAPYFYLPRIAYPLTISSFKLALSLTALLLSASVSGDARYPTEFDGFLDARIGVRTGSDPNQKSSSIGELRLQFDAQTDIDEATLNLVTDFLLDPVSDRYTPDLETGEGVVDLRQLNVLFSPTTDTDIKLGRQTLTWGTGDLLFINDLFSKDWNSFLIGRDPEYLKAPADAMKLSFFHDIANIDLVYTPRFEADRYIDGTRISFFDRSQNTRRGREDPLTIVEPDRWFHDDEVAIRLYRTFEVYETAIYYYRGYWKSPAGQDPSSGAAIFPELQVFGASLRGPLATGIGNVEAGYYRSDDKAAFDPLLRNSELRLLVGYEREIATELTAAVQYYREKKLDYADYVRSLPPGTIRDDKNRSVISLRMTQLLMQQNLTLSLFNFFSPTDQDGYLRLNAAYKIADELRVEMGLNHFYGDQAHTFYAQFERNSNLYAAIRYEFSH